MAGLTASGGSDSLENYYIENIIGSIARKIKELIDDKIITEDKKIVLYGLDTFSFAMRTILANSGFQVDSYVSDDPELLTAYKRRVKAIRARYLNSSRDLIGIYAVEERLRNFDERILVLNASKECSKAKINELKYQDNENFFQTYDWEQDDFAQSMQGKRKMTLKEIQSVEKDILYLVDQFCTDRNIRYWVCGGTMLGTLRHKGFIPWDDDVDVFMPWEDYLVFLREFKCPEGYSLIVPGACDRKNFFELFSKIADDRTMVREDCGFIRKVHPASIDVFPLIGLPDEGDERRLFFRQYYELEKLILEDYYANNGDLDVYNKWYPAQKEFLEKYDFDRSIYTGVLATRYMERDYTTQKVYESTLRMPFEDIEVNVPIGYQEYLDNLYGKGWMELPEENKRISHHNMEAYWL